MVSFPTPETHLLCHSAYVAAKMHTFPLLMSPHSDSQEEGLSGNVEGKKAKALLC